MAITLLAVYVGIAYFENAPARNPAYYNWAIRLSIFIFIIFSFEGGLMGGRQSHTIGKRLQRTFLPIFKWNMKEGDLRVAHFVGMHGLQVIPLLSFYLLKNVTLVFIFGATYLLLAVLILIQALQSKPLIRSKMIIYDTIIEEKTISEK